MRSGVRQRGLPDSRVTLTLLATTAGFHRNVSTGDGLQILSFALVQMYLSLPKLGRFPEGPVWWFRPVFAREQNKR